MFSTFCFFCSRQIVADECRCNNSIAVLLAHACIISEKHITVRIRLGSEVENSVGVMSKYIDFI